MIEKIGIAVGLLIAMLLMSSCAENVSFVRKRLDDGSSPPRAGAAMQPTDFTATVIEGRWRSGCIAARRTIYTLVMRGNLMTWTAERFSDTACTGPGQTQTLGQSHFTATLNDAASARLRYADGDWQGFEETVQIEYGTTPTSLVFDSDWSLVYGQLP